MNVIFIARPVSGHKALSLTLGLGRERIACLAVWTNRLSARRRCRAGFLLPLASCDSLYNKSGPSLHLKVELREVLPDHPDAEKLHAAEEIDGKHGRSPPGYGLVGEQP